MVRRLVCVVAAVVIATGCENAQFGAREKGALGGAAVGAGLGAIVGNQTGHPGAGVAIGSAIGAVSGGLIGQGIQNTDDEIAARQQRIDEQQRQLDENRRLIEELRSRGADVRMTERGVVVNLPDVLFAFGKADLTSSAGSTVREIASVVRGYNGRRIAVEGHTDSVGGVAYNQRLSEDRARSVASALTRQGVPRSVLSVRGFGETDPIASNSTDEGRTRNRRVEVIIENEGRKR